MKIEIKKKTAYQCEYTITRNDQSVELISLDTKTFFLHDICHYVVEKQVNYSKGFWGMLAQGYTLSELYGKDNPQTAELRFIEQIIGPVQSVYWGHIPEEHFEEFIQHLDFNMTKNVLTSCLTEIKTIIENWQQLPVGQELTLEWNV